MDAPVFSLKCVRIDIVRNDKNSTVWSEVGKALETRWRLPHLVAEGGLLPHAMLIICRLLNMARRLSIIFSAKMIAEEALLGQ
jgi:hypothetical protein